LDGVGPLGLDLDIDEVRGGVGYGRHVVSLHPSRSASRSVPERPPCGDLRGERDQHR
jgi:hypothetical protein